MKKSLLLLLSLVVASTTLLGSASAHSSRRATTVSWLQYRRDNQRSGSDPYETQITPANANPRLSKIIGMPFDGPTPPLIYGGVLYTVAVSFVEPGMVETEMTTAYAMDAVTGNIKWTYDLGCYGSSGVPAISVTARILIVPMGVYCLSQSGSGRFVALDLTTGQPRWRWSWNHSGTPAVVGGTVYDTMSDMGPGTIVSIDGTTGVANWMTEATVTPQGAVGTFGDPTVASGVVYARERMGDPAVSKLTALNASTGARLWTTAGSATGDPTVAGSRIYVSCDKGLCAYDTLGRFKWSYAGAGGQIAVASGKVYTGCDVSDVCALNATTGALVWRFDGESQVSSATVAGGIVYVRTPGVVGSIDAASGAFLSDGTPFADGFGPPGTEAPVVANGRVYLVSDNRIYVYGQQP